MTLISIVTGDLGQLLVFSHVLLMEVKMLKIQVLIARLFCTILINYNYEDMEKINSKQHTVPIVCSQT